jgi:murein DD-endopeptidase MepM/ murein hydrolase activator NlpD
VTRGGFGAAMASIAVTAGSCVPPSTRLATAATPKPTTPVPAPVEMRQPTVAAEGLRLTGAPQQGAVLLGEVQRGTLNLTLDGNPVRVAADGRFVIAFDRDAGTTAALRATLPDGRATELQLVVAARSWRIETIGTVRRFSRPSAEFTRLRPAELAQINAARRVDAQSDGWRQRFIWPVTGRISGLFGSQRIYANGEKGDYHSGVDVARPTGTPVIAPADGVVVLAAERPFSLEGNLLILDHGMGLNSAFLHLSRIDVKRGDPVRQGQLVGAVGATGRASGPHLHWGMKWQDRRIDPLLLAPSR